MTKKQSEISDSKQKKLAKKIHNWAYTDAQKNPKKFSRLFKEIWESRFAKEKQ